MLMTPTDSIISMPVGVLFFNYNKREDDFMAVSLAMTILLGLMASRIFERFNMPGLLGMIILGIIIGPYGLGILHANMISISADLRKIALIIILLRAGLGINKEDLKKNGITALNGGIIAQILLK